MTALLEARAPAISPAEIARSIRDRVPDWRDPGAAAQAVAEHLAGELKRPIVSIFRVEDGTGDLVLQGTAPVGAGRSPKGSRRTGDRSVLDAALREGSAQRNLNYYTEPDFVRSLPGETRSALAVPIRGGDGVLGLVHLEYSTPSTPTSADEEITEYVAAYLGVAWDAVRGAHGDAADLTAGKRLSAAAGVAALSSSLAQTEDYTGLLGRIPEMAVELLNCGGALLLMRHRSRQMLEVIASVGAVELPVETLIPMDGTRVGTVARNGKPIEVTGASDPDGDPILPESLLSSPIEDAVAVPVASGGKMCGVLLVVDSGGKGGFTSTDVQLIQALADQAGAAEAIRSIGPLRQKISDAALIAEVGRAMTGTLGLDDVLALVVRGAEMLVSGQFASVALLSPDRESVILAAASGTLQGKQGMTLAARETVLGWVAKGGECLITDALATDERGWPLGDDFGPAVLVPLESRGTILGVLLAGRAAGAASPSDDDLDAVRKLGSHAAIAIDNARLYREQTDLSQTLKIQAQELEKAYTELGTSQERLLVSEKMAALGRVTAGIAHEINSPLGSILNCLQLAITYGEEYRESAKDPEVTPDDHVGIATDLLEALRLAEDATRRVGQFVRTIKGQTRMEEERVEPFDPANEIESTLLLLRHELNDGRIVLEADLERGLQVRGDSNKFAVVVQNLISNAVDAYDGGEGTVGIRLHRRDAEVVLEVSDHGSGISEDIRSRIFDYLFTTKDVGHGTGLGLSLAHSIITSHFHGTIDYTTEMSVGTNFIVILPIFTEI